MLIINRTIGGIVHRYLTTAVVPGVIQKIGKESKVLRRATRLSTLMPRGIRDGTILWSFHVSIHASFAARFPPECRAYFQFTGVYALLETQGRRD